MKLLMRKSRPAGTADSMSGFRRTRYALIAAHYGDADAERFVIAYRSERSLRQFIAAARIIASGFTSAEEAIGNQPSSGVRKFANTVAARLRELEGSRFGVWCVRATHQLTAPLALVSTPRGRVSPQPR
jgi:hypothetical protein